MLRPSAALLALAQAGQSITLAPGTFRAELLVHAQDNATNFATTALGLGQNGLPVVMFGSDLSPPFEIAAFEPSDNDRDRNRDRRRETESHPIWTFDTTAVADRQMTTVVSTSTAAAADTSRIDSVIFWVTKTQGIMGDCRCLISLGLPASPSACLPVFLSISVLLPALARGNYVALSRSTRSKALVRRAQGIRQSPDGARWWCGTTAT